MKGEAQRWSLISVGEWKDASGRRYLIRREISVRLDAKEQKVNWSGVIVNWDEGIRNASVYLEYSDGNAGGEMEGEEAGSNRWLYLLWLNLRPGEEKVL